MGGIPYLLNSNTFPLNVPNMYIFYTLTLKGLGYFTNEKDRGGGGIMGPPFISAHSKVKRLIFSGS